MTQGSKRFRSIICTLVSFFLSVSLTLIALLVCFKATALNKNYALKIIEKTGYCEQLQSELKEHFISYGSACNIDESFFDSVFEEDITADTVYEYTADTLSEFYGKESNGKTVETLESALLEKLKAYAKEKGYDSDEEIDSNLETMSREMGELFEAYAGLFNSSYFQSASSVLERYMPLFNGAVIGLAVFALLSVIVIRLFFAKAKNYLRYYIYAACGSTLMLAVAPGIALIMKLGSRISVANSSLYGFASQFINGVFVAVIIAAAVMALISVALIIIRRTSINNEQQE